MPDGAGARGVAAMHAYNGSGDADVKHVVSQVPGAAAQDGRWNKMEAAVRRPRGEGEARSLASVAASVNLITCPMTGCQGLCGVVE